MEKNINIQAKTLEEASFKLELKIKKGFFLSSFNETKPEIKFTTNYSGKTIKDAVTKAKKNFQKDKGNILNHVIQKEKEEKTIEIAAKNIKQAEIFIPSAIVRHNFIPAFLKLGKLELYSKGKRKGILKISKQANIYQLNIIQYPVITLRYQTWATINAKITDNIELANEKLLESAESGNYYMVKRLTEQDININTCTTDGRNALLKAAANGHSKIALLLTEKGIDVHKTDNKGDNALTIGDELLENEASKNQLVEKLIEKGLKKPDKYYQNYCSNCKKRVSTYLDSYDYDNGYYTREQTKCKECNSNIGSDRVIQN